MTVGAIGTMTLAVMTRASLGHGPTLIGTAGNQGDLWPDHARHLAAELTPLAGDLIELAPWLAPPGAAPPVYSQSSMVVLVRPRVRDEISRPI